MTRKWMVFGMAALAGAVLCLVSATAQPPRFRDDKKKDTKADPAVEAWAKTLVDKLTDKNEAVRDSARAALVAVGKPALPALKKAAGGDDKAAASAAKAVMAQIDGPRRGGRDTTPDRPGRDNPQDRPRFGGFGGGNLLDRITRDLDLTDKQKDKVKDIVTAQEKKMRDAFEKAREGGRPDFQKIRDSMKSMQEDLVKDLKGVLTPEQMKKVEKALENGIGGFGGSRGPGGPGGRGPGFPGRGGDRNPGNPDTPRRPETAPQSRTGPFYLTPALKGLDLSAKQKDQAQAIGSSYDKKVQALFDKATEAKERPDFAAVGKLLADAMKELKGVLTDEQFQKLEKAITQGGSEQGGRRREF